MFGRVNGLELQARIQRHVSRFIAEWKQPAPFDWRSTLAIVVGAVVLLPLTLRLPALGYEWYFYHNGTIGANYPPYLHLAIRPLTVIEDWRLSYAIVVGLLLMGVAVATAREAFHQSRLSRSVAVVMVLLTAPVFMLLWEGNASALSVFSLLALPLGIPLALVQPHINVWAVISRRQWFLWAVAFGILTIVIWGLWPLRLMDVPDAKVAHPVSMGWLRIGWPILLMGIFMLLFSNADPLRLMAAGAFLTPYTLQVHLIVLIPAIGRAQGRERFFLWLSAWLLLLPAMFVENWSKYLAMIFPLAVWWFLRPRKVEVETEQQAFAASEAGKEFVLAVDKN